MGVPVELLRRVPLLSTVDDAELADLAGRFCERGFDRGSPVVSRGSSGAGFFIIAQGEAPVHAGDKTVARLGKGAFFGEGAPTDRGGRSRALPPPPHTRCSGLPSHEFA